jgi:hypothetical protein
VTSLERINVSTGETSTLYQLYTDWREPHDIDHLHGATFVVAEIETNRVYAINTTTDTIEWSWQAQHDIALDSGGAFKQDFTHLNDVEVLSDGRIMVSLRNQDRVVFIEPGEGINTSWTLGEEDHYEILAEQHNPDYIPAKNGGPAVLVADSENDRVVEYQRVGDEWEESWSWTTRGLHWPRDADRLPGGHTLVTDSNGGRVMELNRDGDVVWSVGVNTPYEAERLGTGDESQGGKSASSLGITGSADANAVGAENDDSEGGVKTALIDLITSTIPHRVLNGVLFVLPPWMYFREILAILALVVAGVSWAGFEWYLSDYSVRIVKSGTE